MIPATFAHTSSRRFTSSAARREVVDLTPLTSRRWGPRAPPRPATRSPRAPPCRRRRAPTLALAAAYVDRGLATDAAGRPRHHRGAPVRSQHAASRSSFTTHLLGCLRHVVRRSVERRFVERRFVERPTLCPSRIAAAGSPPTRWPPAQDEGAPGRELEVRGAQPAEDPRRFVLEAAVAGRAVVLLREADVAHPVEDALEADAALGPGQRPAGAGVGAASEGDVLLAFGRSSRNSAGHSNRRGSRLAAPLSSITGVPAGMSTPPTVVARRARRKSAFTGLSMRSASSMKSGMRSRWARSSSWSSGYSARYLRAVASRRAVVS